jgi:diaminohydroxyphosphoribosylaminopyrimidine deaminase / 5-amino-6-(5-phosphoribosylamino)uracil reductase
VSDREWMAQALALAALGEGTTRPNPLVGCVIVNDGVLVGRGFHRVAGEPHAEALALEEAGARARAATLYVNLEPCAHQGRTAPCSAAIVRAGIGRVVAAIVDPNPVVNGRGLSALKAAGIAVTDGVLSAEARALNAPFLSTHERGRPWVTLKAAQSLDGRIAAASGRSTWVTGEASRRYAHRLRFRHDAICVGAGTVRRDDPSLTVRLPDVDAVRRRVVLAPRLGLDPAAKVFVRQRPEDPPTRVYVAAGCPEAEVARFRDVAELVPVAHSAAGFDLAAVLADLHGIGVQSVMVEGGGKTSGAFVNAGLVDDVVLFVADRLFGSSDATPVVDMSAASEPGKAWRFVRSATIPLGEDVVLVGRLEAP